MAAGMMMVVFWDFASCRLQVLTDVIIINDGAVRCTEAFVSLYETAWSNIPEDCEI
jgi:hypothetical protein